MHNLPQISNGEFEVMDVIWKHAPINTNEIVEILSKRKIWNPKTIQTMLFRLEKKGIITHTKEGRVFVYAPRIPKEAYLALEQDNFVNRFFDGAVSQMVASYLDKNELTEAELAELQEILDKKRNQ